MHLIQILKIEDTILIGPHRLLQAEHGRRKPLMSACLPLSCSKSIHSKQNETTEK